MGRLEAEVAAKIRVEEALVQSPDPAQESVFGVGDKVTMRVTVVRQTPCASWREARSRMVARALLLHTVPVREESTLTLSSLLRG